MGYKAEDGQDRGLPQVETEEGEDGQGPVEVEEEGCP